tara:strand:+ start:1162 stop:1398 length:237 start_codon:yes stop_codon:yes gene_type:complete
MDSRVLLVMIQLFPVLKDLRGQRVQKAQRVKRAMMALRDKGERRVKRVITGTEARPEQTVLTTNIRLILRTVMIHSFN